MSVFPAGYTMVPNGMNYTLQPQYGGVNYQMPIQQVQPVQQQMVPVQQPVMQQQVQQVQQNVPQQPMVLGGKMVDVVDVVRALDIPMDGGTYYFPKADGTEIYTKRWMPNGTTEMVVFKREMEPPSQETRQVLDSIMCKDDIVAMQSGLNEKLDQILGRVSKLEEAFK